MLGARGISLKKSLSAILVVGIIAVLSRTAASSITMSYYNIS